MPRGDTVLLVGADAVHWVADGPAWHERVAEDGTGEVRSREVCVGAVGVREVATGGRTADQDDSPEVSAFGLCQVEDSCGEIGAG